MLKLLGIILDLIHFIVIFIPIIIYFIPINIVKKYFKYALIILILIPLHWGINNDKCFLTNVSIELGTIEPNNFGFSEVYLGWLYKPIMSILGWEWNETNINKMVYSHWIINFILLWYYLFFIGKCSLI